MALAGHEAANRYECGRTEAELLGPKQRRDHHVASRAHAAVGAQ